MSPLPSRALFAALCLTAAAAQADPSTVPYVVQGGEDCGDVAEHALGDRKALDRLHDANPQLGPLPHNLKAGQVLQIPRGGPAASISFVRNRVEAQTPAPHAAALREELSRGHRVSTFEASSAEVTFVDASRVQLGEQTLVVILGGTSSKVARKSTASDTTLVSGSLRAHLGELAGDAPPAALALATPHGKVELHVGEAQVQADRAAMRLSVYRGTSTIEAGGKKVTVPSGFGSKARAARRPDEPQALPPAPEWMHAPARALFAAADGVEIVGSFHAGGAPGPQAAEWHVQLARDEAFNDLFFDGRVPALVRELRVRQVPTGEYFARVSAIDADKFEGPFAPVARVAVGEMLHTPGRAGEGGHAAFVEVPAGWRCGLDGAPLADLGGKIELAPGLAHVLRCSPGDDAKSAAEAKFDVVASGPLVSNVSFLAPEANEFGGRRRVLVRLTDGAGRPIVGARVEAALVDGQLAADERKRRAESLHVHTFGIEGMGATISSVHPLAEPGSYGAVLDWSNQARSMSSGSLPLRFVVNGKETFDAVAPEVQVAPPKRP